ncbi:MAG: acyltransferase family protein [Candidatus Omnitrophica bacterium]|nr:acyltransferase family protein [Candidatus Omnitrophota bacterium]
MASLSRGEILIKERQGFLLKENSPAINVIRGIAIVLVVAGHVIQRTMSINGEDFFLNPVFKIIYTFHMPLFFFISGFVMAFSLNRQTPWEVLKKRYRSLCVPLLSWGILGVVGSYYLHLSSDLSVWFIWFLFTLFISSCILLCSVQFERRLGLWAFGGMYLIILILPYNHYFYLYFIQWFYVFYLAGYFFNRYGMNGISQRGGLGAFLVALIVFSWLSSLWTKNDYIYIHQMNFTAHNYVFEILRMGYRYVLGFLGIFMTFMVGHGMAKRKIGLIFGYIGIFSLDIYLIQRYIVESLYPSLLGKLHLNFDCNGPLFLGIYVPLMAMFFVSMCLLISKFLIRKNELLNRFLLGGRR